ncbi:hypothetical protein ACJZ2D_008167 [Fusarium nematophilum]
MRYVYANAAFNVAASASSDPEGGLFRERDPESVQRPAYVSATLAEEGRQDYYVVSIDYWDKYMRSGPLHKRGWVFQERFLAPGVLYFTKHQVLWECLTEHSCEGYPRGIPFPWYPKNFQALWPEEGEEEEGLFGDSRHTLWTSLVMAYSDCSFTKREDMVVAFSGLAKVFQEHCKDDYVAGLWKSRLPEMLEWKVASSGEAIKPPAEYLAPSWSWASVGGPVSLSDYHGCGRCLLSLLDVETVNRGQDPTAGVVYGRITLRGLLFPATYVRTGPPPRPLIRSLSTEIDCYLDFGSDEEFSTERSVFLVPISGFEILEVNDWASRTLVRVSCLVLEKCLPDNTPDTYRRIGHCTLQEEEDILQHHIDLCKETAVMLRPGAPLTEINIV